MRIRLHDPIMTVTVVLMCILVAGLITTSLSCAKNQLLVEETMPDTGAAFKIKQTTYTSWGAKTGKGYGGVEYTADGGDGSNFSLIAGSEVEDQISNDPSVGLANLLGALGKLLAGLQPTPAVEVPPPVDPRLPSTLLPELNALTRNLLDNFYKAAELNGYDIPRRYGNEPPSE